MWRHIAAAALILIAYRILSYRWNAKGLLVLPRVPGHVPWVGCVTVMKAIVDHQLHQWYTNSSKNPAYRGMRKLMIFGTEVVLVTSPASWTAFHSNRAHMPKPLFVGYGLFLLMGIKRQNLLTEQDQAEHSRLRKAFSKFFHKSNIDQFVGRLISLVQEYMVIIESPGAGNETKQSSSFDIGVVEGGEEGTLVDAQKLAVASVQRVVFEVMMRYDKHPSVQLLYEILQDAAIAGANPIFKWLTDHGLMPNSKRFARNREELYQYHRGLTDDILQRPEPPEGCTELWACIRDAFPRAQHDEEQYERMLSNVFIMYTGAYETTTVAITCTLVAIALEQYSQDALVKELDEMELLVTPERPNPRSVTAQDLSSMRVLNAIVHESLRLMPPSLLVNKLLKEDFEVEGVVVPKGTVLMLSAWALHRDRNAWGDDCEEWRHERWLQGPTVEAAKKDKEGNTRWSPFQDGPANCIGWNLAMVEIKLFVAMLVSRFEIRPDAARMPDCKVSQYIADHLRVQITLKIKEPAMLRMKKRV